MDYFIYSCGQMHSLFMNYCIYYKAWDVDGLIPTPTATISLYFNPQCDKRKQTTWTVALIWCENTHSFICYNVYNTHACLSQVNPSVFSNKLQLWKLLYKIWTWWHSLAPSLGSFLALFILGDLSISVTYKYHFMLMTSGFKTPAQTTLRSRFMQISTWL